MSVLAMFCWIGINLNDEKKLNQILNQILNTAYFSKYKILVFSQGCSYLKWVVVYGMGALISFGRKSRNHCFFYLISPHELSGYFPWFVVRKSLRIEVFHTGLVYHQWGCHMPRYFTVSSKNSQKHAVQVKLGTWKASSLAVKALASNKRGGGGCCWKLNILFDWWI